MPTDTTGSDHILLSSDSETSNDRNENLTMAPTLISSISELFNISRNTEIIEGISNISTSSQNIQTIFHIQNYEIKLIGFNDEVERIYHLMLLNKTIIIENGRIQKSNENYRTAYSLFDIRLVSNTNVQLYKSNIFNPNIKITKRTIHDITQLANDSNVDTEGQIIKDNGVSTTTSQTNGSTFQRRSIKIQDETGKINITIWNKKNEEIPDNVINQHIRIRNGKINVYN
ncbi:unnamed protein product, partial [Rotaria magnacalcarata]